MNRLDNLSFAFDVAAPEDATIQNELTAMGAEERGKQALYIMLMKTYLGHRTDRRWRRRTWQVEYGFCPELRTEQSDKFTDG